MGKSESEISKWLTGLHNLELRTIYKIEAVLGEDIIEVKEAKVEMVV
jgi:transcriptional regulator with XRE-family HTH domain